MQRRLIIVAVVLLVLMGLPILMPGMSMSMLDCPACLLVLFLAVSLMVLIVSAIRAPSPAFAAQWHPRPLQRPPRAV